MRDREYLNAVTERVIGSAMEVSNVLGVGFLEKVYENALVLELQRNEIPCKRQVSISVAYKGSTAGEYIIDLLVDERIIVELKAVRSLDDVHAAQCLNYLKATGYPLCLLINFGRPRLEIRRLVLD